MEHVLLRSTRPGELTGSMIRNESCAGSDDAELVVFDWGGAGAAGPGQPILLAF
jgi:hypothetical protein